MCLGNGSVTAAVLAEGVENMQILYGEDTDNDLAANLYVNASKVTDFTKVVSVRIALLINTVDIIGTYTDNQVHILLNSPPIGPLNDNLVRRVFVRTIVLRNQRLDT
jgi:type IV pilus assembly protein PilW